MLLDINKHRERCFSGSPIDGSREALAAINENQSAWRSFPRNRGTSLHVPSNLFIPSRLPTSGGGLIIALLQREDREEKFFLEKSN
jgi:hypothetical protein